MSTEMKFLLLAIATAAIVTIQHLTFGRWWRRNELARRTLGIATVLGMSLLSIPLGLMDWQSWLIVTGLFGVAGATLAALVITECELSRNGRIAQKRKQVEEYAENDK